ncbi:LPXTG cell wall anchor domain-containing protein, partial [Staphylococcus sp. HMSC62A08]
NNGQNGPNNDQDGKHHVTTEGDHKTTTTNIKKEKTELPDTGVSSEAAYTTTVFGTISLASALLLFRRQRKSSK